MPKKRAKLPPKTIYGKKLVVMDNDKKMNLVLLLSDIAEGIGTMIEAMKLTASGLDDVANLLRETVNEKTNS